MAKLLAIAVLMLSLSACAPLIVGGIAGGVVAHQMTKRQYAHSYQVCDYYGRCRLVTTYRGRRWR